ncbi:hypothetical protein BKA59DRAFT_545743 [Fusarium tricinctum]|uniref:Uncharacterized protein n=1 Tax=Fusarium tricinctum TaxID=61284 RepID=A0A8K0RYN7_9HYPO|nr:hypothetical protein BKA59DRAFT_545743 [Fusarium tricinctum]
MSVTVPVVDALAEFEFDPDIGFSRLGLNETSCLYCALSVYRDNRLVCVVDQSETCCAWCHHNHKKCIANGICHSAAEVDENLWCLIPLYTRQCVEASTFVSLLERLDFAATTSLDHETEKKKGKWPKKLPTEFIVVMYRCIADGNLTPRIVKCRALADEDEDGEPELWEPIPTPSGCGRGCSRGGPAGRGGCGGISAPCRSGRNA